MLRLLLVAFLVLSGCGTGAPPLPPPNGQSVSAYFDNPPAYPGYRWTRNGKAVSPAELTTVRGPSHCNEQKLTLLTIGWPPGTVSRSAAGARQYIRAVPGAPDWATAHLRTTFKLNPVLPADARDTGYQYLALHLYLAPSDQDAAIYMVGGVDSERWPRSDPPAICA
jgi:hypothetical protein